MERPSTTSPTANVNSDVVRTLRVNNLTNSTDFAYETMTNFGSLTQLTLFQNKRMVNKLNKLGFCPNNWLTRRLLFSVFYDHSSINGTMHRTKIDSCIYSFFIRYGMLQKCICIEFNKNNKKGIEFMYSAKNKAVPINFRWHSYRHSTQSWFLSSFFCCLIVGLRMNASFLIICVSQWFVISIIWDKNER